MPTKTATALDILGRREATAKRAFEGALAARDVASAAFLADPRQVTREKLDAAETELHRQSARYTEAQEAHSAVRSALA